jgi:hypothetical protein
MLLLTVKRQKYVELDIKHDLIKAKEIRLIKFMQSRAERVLNPNKYCLSDEVGC